MKTIVGLHGEKMSMETGILIIKNGHSDTFHTSYLVNLKIFTV